MQEIRIMLAVFLGILLLLLFQSLIHFTLLQRRVLLLHERIDRLERMLVDDSLQIFDAEQEY
ncbi:MAG: hypothetical protein KatS3mg087_1547 [Patescibacteria group bacterium]|nr:MAG: hypothetical protein KatS3mg087_1547 [Patescibacteria group bacterium]